MNDLLVEFWRCNCGKPYRSQHATFQRLFAFLPSQSIYSGPAILLCDACNLIRSYSKTALGCPGMVDSSNQERYVRVEKLFRAQIACAEKSCEPPIEIFVPSTVHWTKDALRRKSRDWKPDASVVCLKGHPAEQPARVLNLERLFPARDPMEDGMTAKEMALAVLDQIEQAESERASLGAFASTMRDLYRNQPPLKELTAADKSAIDDTTRAKHAELRRLIALAADDNAALVLLKGLLEN